MANRIPSDLLSPAKPARKPSTRKPAAPRPSKRTVTLRHQASIAARIIGVTALALSVVHCTEAVSLLTGSHWFLAMLLAIAVDAGMVVSELAETVGDHDAKVWALGYIGLSVAMSMGLNAYAFALHATVPSAGVALGIVIPALVLILNRIATHLAK